MEFKVSLSGNKRVDAHVGQFVIKTDQSVDAGGDASAPEPFALFLASIGACAGVYVVYFCQARDIPTEGIEVIQRMDFDPESSPRLQKVTIEIRVPPTFPEKYLQAVARAASNCAVKKTILNPPEFDVNTVVVG